MSATVKVIEGVGTERARVTAEVTTEDVRMKPTTSAIARSAEHGSPGLEFEDVVAAPRQDMEICLVGRFN
jgi:3,4-dihydroxy-2-butanone 4-phosphate synthase